MQVSSFKRFICFIQLGISCFFLFKTLKIANKADSELHSSSTESSKIRRLPQAICIGAKKCGTGALKDFLSHHPLIATPSVYEVHFFDNNEEYAKGIEYYRSLMPRTLASQITFEKTPKYMVIPEVPKRIFSMDSNIKIIIVACEPKRRAYSEFIKRLQSKYTSRRFRAFRFQKDQILIINGEELLQNPAKPLIEVQQFLDIPAVLTSDNFVLDEKKHFFCFLKNAKMSCLNDSKGKTRSEGGPKFSEEFTKEADAFFETYNKELFAFLGVKILQGW
ncbi:unnamed protein product [Oikopleura dioica]|uniref:Sulfotransferase n=1 Tax=Oikopleura dioica TaxID=34765 RepID=E4X0W0_OIKDI|nr:unnamed protein product [Oikopleura dioica]